MTIKTSMAAFWALAAVTGAAQAQEYEDRPLTHGLYVAPMFTYSEADDDSLLDSGIGGTVAVGWRFGALAAELAGEYLSNDFEDGGGSSDMIGASLSALVFPFVSVPGFYGKAGVGYVDRDGDSAVGCNLLGNNCDSVFDGFEGAELFGGLGIIVPIRFGDYEFGIRAEALARHNRRDDTDSDDNQIREFNDYVGNLGVHLPFGKYVEEPPPEPAPVQVVEVLDSDGDGVIDEHDQCPNTPQGTEVDGRGCPLPPPPECESPGPGESLSLAGCGEGDVIVLRGVNFEFDKAKLTVNAKTILDAVAEELQRYPEVEVELSGHTDSLGTESYNQSLSDRRARSVYDYLASHGVAARRMTAVGFGESRPVADNSTEEGRELNRRVELRITAAPDTAEVVPASGEWLPADSEPAPAAESSPEADMADEMAPAETFEPAQEAEPAPEPADGADDISGPDETGDSEEVDLSDILGF